jgi:succinate dehydrogenase / fumarate reductase cytochrome b subunit
MTTHYLLRRLHSLSGIVPVGVFLARAPLDQRRAAGGRASFDHAVGQIQSIPGLPLIELFGIALPLAFHALYGVFLALRAKGNVRQYPYPRNWMFTLQRVTGFVAFAFIALHVAQLRVPKAFGALPWTSFYSALQTMLGEPGMFGVYLIGVTACVVHFANGLWGASQTWGLASSPRASRRAGQAALAAGGAAVAPRAAHPAAFLLALRRAPAVARGAARAGLPRRRPRASREFSQRRLHPRGSLPLYD